MKTCGGAGRGKRIIVLVVCCAFVFASCSKENKEAAGRLYEFESGLPAETDSGGRIAELEKDVAALKAAVNEKVAATDKLGSYYKFLALAYIDKQMYGKALEAIEEAVRIHPEQHSLFIYRAISAARLAKALKSEAEKASYMKLAEDSYLRAIALDSGSVQALYGLAVLYTYEFDQPQNALPLLERILRKESRNVDALFVLGATHYLMGNTEAALETYDRIIAISSAGLRRDEAKKNKERILEEAMR
jgi:tetratricopeptide (TPR) repeat protein